MARFANPMHDACDVLGKEPGMDKVAVWWRDENGMWVKAHETDSWEKAHDWAMAAAVYDPELVGIAQGEQFDTPGYVVY